MLINNIDITTYNAELIDRIISTAAVHSVTEWLDNAVSGTFLRQNRDWHNLRLTFLIKESNEDVAYKRIAVLTEALKYCTIRFDDIQLDFTCALEGTNAPERLQNGVFRVAFTLKNYHATETEVTYHQAISAINAKKIKINYYRNWSTTMGYYTGCFETDEIYEKIAEEDLYIDINTIEAKAREVTSWNTLFLNLGVDINKYKSINEANGFVDIEEEYNINNVLSLFNNISTFTIYYNRLQMDGFPDLPKGKVYPSLAWRAPEDNNYYFQTDVGSGWNAQDISIYVTGRYFKNQTSTNGALFGAGENLSLWNTANKVYFVIGDSNKYQDFNVFSSNSSGTVINTLEDISSMPMRLNGIKSTNQGAAPIVGYADLQFNGSTLSEVPVRNAVLSSNIMIGRGFNAISDTNNTVTNADIARVQIYYQGKLIRDYIPVLFNLKNGFYNNYDTGLYDMITMSYLPWSGNAGVGPTPGTGLLPVPNQEVIPDVPTPPVSTIYSVTVSGGSGSGNYEPGALVTISAAPPSGKHFNNWQITGVVVSNNTLNTLSFYMPTNNVIAIANYIDDETQPDVPTPTPSENTYTVYATNASGGGKYKKGDLVILKANEPTSGYIFKTWQITGVNIENLQTTNISFYMPENDVSAAVIYEESGTPIPTPEGAHILKVINGSGSGTYYFGEQIRIKADGTSAGGQPFKNWQLEGVTVGDINQQILTFYMPDNDVTAIAVYYEENEPVERSGGWLLYWTPNGSPEKNYNTEQVRGKYALDWDKDAVALFDNDGVNYYAFVFQYPNITPTNITYYSTSRITIGTPTKDKWGRYVIPWRAPSGLRGDDQFIRGVIGTENGPIAYKQTFNLYAVV